MAVGADASTVEAVTSKRLNFIAIKDGLEEYYTIGDDDIVKSWRGPLEMFNMSGWKRVSGGFVRPVPDCPCRGMGIRERTVQFE